MSVVDPSIDFVNSVLADNFHALAIQSGSLVARTLFLAYSSEAASAINPVGTCGDGEGTVTSCSSSNSTNKGALASRERSSLETEPALSSSQMDAIFRLLERACANSEVVRSLCLQLCSEEAQDQTSSGAASIVKLLTEVLLNHNIFIRQRFFR